jgi:hypothetical protein
MLVDDLPPLYRTAAHARASPEAAELRRAAARGALVRLHQGVFTPSDDWARLDAVARHCLRLRAVLPRLAGRVVVSHESAAALHGLPLEGRGPTEVHVTDPARTGGRRSAGVVTHCGPLPEGSVVEVDGQRVTSMLRTCVDLALRGRLRSSVPVLDAALRTGLVDEEGLLAELEASGRVHGARAARAAVLFADGRAQLPGESLTRVVLRELGAPAPILQQEFRDAEGRVGFVDFWFGEQRVVLEFDGDAKYTEARYRGGRSAERVALDERKRERRLLRLPEVREVVRTDWAEVHAPRRLALALRGAGVPLLHS